MTEPVPASGVDAGVAAHYGDPLGEQRRVVTGAGVVDRGHRGVVLVSGPDRLPWLHSICSQHLSDLPDGASTQALVLSPHGHVEQHWQVTELDGTVWIDVEPGTVAEVVAYLEKMRFLKQVEITDASEQWAVLSVLGPDVDAVLAAAGIPVPDARAGRLDGGGLVRRGGLGSLPGVDLIVARDRVHAVVRALADAGAGPAGAWAYHALRVAAREPRLAYETDHRTIPHEVGWIGAAVHLDKGCYRGQETVARVQNLGRPPRRLVLLQISDGALELPDPGEPVELDGRAVGFVGTAVHHFEDGPIALAVIKRALPDDAPLEVAGHRVAVDPGAVTVS